MEKKKLLSILKEIRNIAGESSLTGMFKNSAPVLVKNYNAILGSAKKDGLVTGDVDLVTELPETADIDEVGVAAAILLAYLDDDSESPASFPFSKFKMPDSTGQEPVTGSTET
jgi:hypothetical protein